MNELICIHPINENLRFLRKLIRKLRDGYSEQLVLLRLSNNTASHQESLTKLKSAPQNSLVCFLGHGATKVLYGCTYRYENHPEYYDYRIQPEGKYFIDKDNIEILKNKNVICLSCNSISLGKIAIESGVKCFVGFTDINFDDEKSLVVNQKSRLSVEAKVKYSLRRALFQSLDLSLKHSLTFYQLKQLFKISLYQESDRLILENKEKQGFKYYKAAADCIQEIRYGIQLFGDGNLKVL